LAFVPIEARDSRQRLRGDYREIPAPIAGPRAAFKKTGSAGWSPRRFRQEADRPTVGQGAVGEASRSSSAHLTTRDPGARIPRQYFRIQPRSRISRAVRGSNGETSPRRPTERRILGQLPELVVNRKSKNRQGLFRGPMPPPSSLVRSLSAGSVLGGERSFRRPVAARILS